MTNKIHVLNIKLNNREYEALRTIKAYSNLPFNTIVKVLIKNEIEAGKLKLDYSQFDGMSVDDDSEPIDPLPPDSKLQRELKLMQAREELRIAREERRAAQKESERQAKEADRLAREEKRAAQREAERLAREAAKAAREQQQADQKATERLAKEEKRKAESKHKEVLREIRKGTPFAGMAGAEYIKYHESLSPEEKAEIAAIFDEPNDNGSSH